MKLAHAPKVNTRYWTAITLASVFGTNMGDLYAHESGLGIVKGLLLLAILTAIVFTIERFDNLRHQVYYWLVIIIIRTGATNIADHMNFRMRVPEPWLTLGWVAVIVVFGWFTHSALRDGEKSAGALPKTTPPYWLAMLGCGVFGTIFGDTCSKWWGEGIASIVTFAVLLAVLAAGRGKATQMMAIYWTTVAIARTSGTAIGDYLAESKTLNIGLPHATLISGIAFVAVLVFWRSQAKSPDLIVAPDSDAA